MKKLLYFCAGMICMWGAITTWNCRPSRIDGQIDVYYNSYLNGWKTAAYQLSTDTALIEYMYYTDSLEMAYKLKYK